MRLFRDRDFIREEGKNGKLIPMTKEEIRSAIILKLSPVEDSVCWDIGAGTGSVSIQLARCCQAGRVIAFEKNDDACSLIKKNADKLCITNLDIYSGEFCSDISLFTEGDLQVPQIVFIGGSDGKMMDIICKVRRFALDKGVDPDSIRFAFTAVTLDTVSIISEIRKISPAYENLETVQISVSRTRTLGKHDLLTAENPVFICSFGGEGE